MTTVVELDKIKAEAYQQGFNDGYAMAVAEEVLELQAIKRQQEAEASIARHEALSCGQR